MFLLIVRCQIKEYYVLIKLVNTNFVPDYWQLNVISIRFFPVDSESESENSEFFSFICFFLRLLITFSSEKVLDLCKMGPPPVFVKCPRFETL